MGVEGSSLMRGLSDRVPLESRNPAVRALDRIVAEIAPTQIPVLIVGESGTGKELIALQIHRLSMRQSQLFLKLNCSTLTAGALDELLQSENRGDGAARGVPEAGTVFLDEISELDLVCQPKLLHALPDGDVVRQDRYLHARVISSSRRNPEDEIRSGRFREDLYYRLNDVCLHLPPLRHRKEDIPGLVDFFLAKYSAQFARQRRSLSPQTLAKLMECSWPGNIRQLENVVKKVVALGDEGLALLDLESLNSESPQHGGDGAKLSLKQASRAASQHAERELILRTLERTRWNRKRAAKELQISYKALLYKLKQIGLDDSASSTNSPGEHQ